MFIVFNVPNTIWESSALGTSDFLLFKTPIRKLDFVRKQYAPSHYMDKLEFGLNSSKTFLGLRPARKMLHNFDAEKVIGIPLKSLIPISAT